MTSRLAAWPRVWPRVVALGQDAVPAPWPRGASWPPCRRVGHDGGRGSGSNVSRIPAKEHALGSRTRPRKSRNGIARTDATPRRLFQAFSAPPGPRASSDAKAHAREAIAEVLPAAADRSRVRDPRAPRARHDAEDHHEPCPSSSPSLSIGMTLPTGIVCTRRMSSSCPTNLPLFSTSAGLGGNGGLACQRIRSSILTRETW